MMNGLRGRWVVGRGGSGKSLCVIEGYIREEWKKGFGMVVYE